MKIQDVTVENFKGISGSIRLDDLNLFRGASGSGKSTWLEALRIGLLGHDPSVGKAVSSTMAFASGNRMSVSLFAVGQNKNIEIQRVFERKGTRCSQTIFINGDEKSQMDADGILAEELGDFPVMLDLSKFTDLSDDKKTEFIFALSDIDSSVRAVRRKIILELLSTYTDAEPIVLKYKFDDRPAKELDDEEFEQLVLAILEEIGGRVSEGIRSVIEETLQPGAVNDSQEYLEKVLSDLKSEISVARRTKREAEASNKSLSQRKAKASLGGTVQDYSQRIKVAQEKVQELDKRLHTAKRVEQGIEAQADAIEQSKKLLKRHQDELAKLEAIEEPETEVSSSKLKTVLQELQVESKALLSRQMELSDQKQELLDEKSRLEGRMQQILAAQNALDIEVECPECENTFPATEGTDYEEQLEEIEGELAALNEKLNSLTASQGAVREDYEDNKENINGVQEKLSEVEKEEIKADNRQVRIAQLKDEIKETKEQIQSLEEGFRKQDQEVSIEDLEAQLSGVRESLDSYREQQNQWEELRQIEISMAESMMDIRRAEAVLEAVKRAEKSVKATRNEITNDLTKPIEEVANSLLKRVDKNLELRYEIDERSFAIRCVNFNGRTVHFATLSGGEKVLYSCAQLVALMIQVNPPLKCLQAELGELSGNIVPYLLEAVESMVEETGIQVMMASCHRDFEVDGESWKVLNMEEKTVAA